MMGEDKREFYKKWSLPECRDYPQEPPAAHQAKALGELGKWYAKQGKSAGAGILVLPTGGGKTFTAVRFLAEGPLSDGYKVLWLAHTHHLLEQAFHCFRPGRIGAIREPRCELRLRVVSGTEGHFPPRYIEPTDDVVIGTLQTIAIAVRDGLPNMKEFLKAAGKKLFVVFDEAHHAPAPSYRKLLQGLQAQGAPVLGLTATPIYSDESKQGWLKKLFPSGIIAQSRANELMAAGVLARPHAVPMKTRFTPRFDARDYQKWLGTFKDIPEQLVDELANSKERNAFIAQTYADNREKFRKTIIFTDRWYQCEAIAEALRKHGVKAGSVYSHVDASVPAAQRQKRDANENAKVLARFRNNDLEVLINVRMLTEGTDIPDAQTVFITRQTTSRILLTQMVGRALRGPKFDGTADAYIVSFEDDWRQQIQWAGFDLSDGSAGPGETGKRQARPPLQLISIELVQRLARQMAGGSNVASVPFQSHLPVGWYRTMFDARLPESDAVELADLLVMVYEDERAGFEKLIDYLLAEVPEALADESATLEAHEARVRGWREKFLGKAGRSATDVEVEILQLARHIAQRGAAPQFFAFEVRADHDLDAIAARHIKNRIDVVGANDELRREFAREDRFWRTLFYRYEQFRNFYDGCFQRIIAGPAGPAPDPSDTKKAPPPNEVDEVTKAEVLARDGHACLACGTTRNLNADHVVAVYVGGSNEVGNLQTLCRQCNILKAKQRISFRVARTALGQPAAALPDTRAPASADAANAEAWGRFLRRSINFFYQCAAVGDVAIGQKGDGYYNWTVTLRSDNPQSWLKPHMAGLLERIQAVREAGGKPRVASLRIVAPGQKDLMVKDKG
ncbi:DEAD/DEAH box helicase family protein [Sorangium sp. So ce321]|uniref:DEAD/DEAH box helicase family protein n=1 Tax=Sorangium sp. So ce321 TaxID=3133300 RepID=UPI003F624AB1